MRTIEQLTADTAENIAQLNAVILRDLPALHNQLRPGSWDRSPVQIRR